MEYSFCMGGGANEERGERCCIETKCKLARFNRNFLRITALSVEIITQSLLL